MSWLICRQSLKLYQDESKKSKMLCFLLVLIHAYIPITKSDASFLKPTGHSWPGEFRGGGCEQGFTYDSAATLSLLPPLQLCFQEKQLPWVWTADWVTSPLRRHHSQTLFCFYFYWLVCYLLINSESFRSNLIHVMNSNLGSKQAWSNKMSSTVTKIKLDSRNQSNHSSLFPGLQIPLPAHFPITEK